MKSARLLELRRGDKAKAAKRQAGADAATKLRAILKRSSRMGRFGSKVTVEFATDGEAEVFAKLARETRSRPAKRPL